MNPNPARGKIKKLVENIVLRKNTFGASLLESKVEIKSSSHAQKLINIEPCKDELIDKLNKGDMFGEIGLLTSIRRTCTIITTDSCLMVRLEEDGLNKIKNKFPSIFENIQDSISNYFDRDTCERVRFI